MLPLDAPSLFGILIYPGVEPIDLGGTAGVLSMATRVLPNVRYTIIARDAGPVRLSGGLVVQAEHGFANAPACDVVIVFRRSRVASRRRPTRRCGVTWVNCDPPALPRSAPAP